MFGRDEHSRILIFISLFLSEPIGHACKCSRVGLFNGANLLVPQLAEFVFSRALRECAFPLAQKTMKQINGPVRHIDILQHLLREGIVRFQIGDFIGQIPFDRLLHAFVKEFGMTRSIEVAVIVRRFI